MDVSARRPEGTTRCPGSAVALLEATPTTSEVPARSRRPTLAHQAGAEEAAPRVHAADGHGHATRQAHGVARARATQPAGRCCAEWRQELSGAVDQAEHVFEVAPVVADQADRAQRVAWRSLR